MELEGNLILERRPARRWVSALAVIVPVLACLAGVTWFVRAFVSPPTISIPGPMILAAAPPAPAVRAEPSVAPPPARGEAPAEPSPAAVEAAASPAFTRPPAAPPAFPPAPSREPVATSTAAFADPARETPARTAPASAANNVGAALLAGPIPLPRPRPQETEVIASAVPLPRPRPAEETSAPVQASQPAHDRHSAE